MMPMTARPLRASATSIRLFLSPVVLYIVLNFVNEGAELRPDTKVNILPEYIPMKRAYDL